ncbi:NACHT, LRR and PYD domains-containing protein 12-like [Strongylocentrotus purpuratus]|uniref:NACHT domain-containing protein n=1 Tax=Strongylocentrotus purpuratus TaxID=7668 RepID=A0A7M7NC80_STRPU|nr:NACHT, LRR and PYD domains-containing protein 12-like [Strongylocentrotus purpuratus]
MDDSGDHVYQDLNAPSRLVEQGCDQVDDQADFILDHSYEDFPATKEREEHRVIYSNECDVLLGSSFMYFSSGLSFCRMRSISCTMDGFCLLYLLMILLMRSGDVETNPGPDRIVSEEEFIKLSKLIEPSYYKEVGINLNIPNAELGQITVQHMLNTSDALMTVFTRWRDKQPPGTDIRALLAEGLQKSDLGSLSGELLTGSLVPNRTGAPVPMLGSQTPPLSPDQIKRCADEFKFKYRTSLCKIRSDALNPDSIVPFKDMYTNLLLKEEYRERKRPLEYRDLFDLKVNGEFPKRIMIQGEAGAGKTTFCSKIAWDWINDSPVLPKFVWVLVVPLCEAKQYTIGEIAKSYLSKDNPATASQITEYIRSNPTHVFIAFDGLDEFDGKVVQEGEARSKSECHQPKSADQTKARSERGDIALIDILRSDELGTCPVLVTSRPRKVTEFRWDYSLRKLYTFMYVEGFSKENVEVYIHKYFEDNVATADQLIQLTKESDIISEYMAPHPIYIAMLCLMWRELGDEKQEKLKSFRTFSQIFDERFKFLRVHYAQKKIKDLGSPSFKEYLAQIEKLLKPVANVAFIGLQENTDVFKEDDFEQCSESMETACRVGVLEKRKSFINDKSSIDLQSQIFFPHKLFQEYMAGVHLASLYESDHNEFNRLIEQVVLPRKEEFRYLLYFIVSWDKTIANHVMKCMVQGNTTTQEEMDFLVDVSFESQDLDTVALLRGRVSSLKINFRTAHTIAAYVFTGLYVDVIDLQVHDYMLGPTISHDLAKIICSAPSLEKVSLSRTDLDSDFYVVLAKEGNTSKVKTLELAPAKCLTSASSHHLVNALCSMPDLTELTLYGKAFQEEFYSTLNAKASSLKVCVFVLYIHAMMNIWTHVLEMS